MNTNLIIAQLPMDCMDCPSKKNTKYQRMITDNQLQYYILMNLLVLQ